MNTKFPALILSILLLPSIAMASCQDKGVWLQVLGSGGPELDDGRASTSYLIWVNGKARILIDMGSGSMQRFEQSAAKINDLDLILFTHLHVDHSNDLPALVKASYFSGRERHLPVYGPTGNALMPSMTQFVQGLFGEHGAYRYLSDYLDGSESYRLRPHDIKASGRNPQRSVDDGQYRITAVPVHHGPIPALAWRIEVAGRSFVISGDMNNDYHTLAGLARGAALLIAHHAIPEGAGRVARNLHMSPSVIGEIAAQAGVGWLVLSHRMTRTLGREPESEREIRRHYRGKLSFAEDLQCY
jgi:ribonuclease BN (tRNA processing enzyme)